MSLAVNTKMLARDLLISPRAARHLARTYFHYVFGGAALNERGYTLNREQADDLIRTYRLASTFRLSFEQLLSLRQMHRLSLLAYLGDVVPPFASHLAAEPFEVENQVAAALDRLAGLPETLTNLREVLLHFGPALSHALPEISENDRNG